MNYGKMLKSFFFDSFCGFIVMNTSFTPGYNSEENLGLEEIVQSLIKPFLS